MGIKVIESFIASKYNDMSLCEDGIFRNELFIAVIDGVTAKGKQLWNNKTSGFHAKEVLISAMAELSGIENAEQTLKLLNAALYKEYNAAVPFFVSNMVERLRATIIIYSIKYRQIWCFGDCQFSINGKIYKNEMKIDLLLSELRSTYLRMELLSGKSVDELRKEDPSSTLLFPIIQKQLHFSNCQEADEYCFHVLDGFVKDFSGTVISDVPEGSSVVLASDGYPYLGASLSESENYLNLIEETDPLCIKECKHIAGFTNGRQAIDDRSYIKFKT